MYSSTPNQTHMNYKITELSLKLSEIERSLAETRQSLETLGMNRIPLSQPQFIDDVCECMIKVIESHYPEDIIDIQPRMSGTNIELNIMWGDRTMEELKEILQREVESFIKIKYGC